MKYIKCTLTINNLYKIKEYISNPQRGVLILINRNLYRIIDIDYTDFIIED